MRRLYLKSIRNNSKLSPERKKQLKLLCKKLNIRVRSLFLLDRALTHSSCTGKGYRKKISYERLEFLGDSILNASVSVELFMRKPDYKEGKLSALRSSLVDEKTLAEIAESIGIISFINLGRGEQLADTRARRKVTADIMESIIAVIFFEKGFWGAEKFVRGLMNDHLEKRLANGTRDYKTRLQQYSIDKYKVYPEYAVIGENGPDHNKIFDILVTVNGIYEAIGSARSKKEAEQKAAQKVLNIIFNQDNNDTDFKEDLQ